MRQGKVREVGTEARGMACGEVQGQRVAAVAGTGGDGGLRVRAGG